MGQAPHIAANDASERSLPGLSPAATASLAALTGPHPYIASSAGQFSSRDASIARSMSSAASRAAAHRSASAPRAAPSAPSARTEGSSSISLGPAIPRNLDLSPSGAVVSSDLAVLIAEVRAFTAPERAASMHLARRVGGEPAGQDPAAPPVEDAQPVRVGVGVDPAEDRPAGAGCRFGSHVSLRSFRARLDRADGTLTGRDRMRLFGSAVSLHAPIRSCGGLGSPRPARDMSGNEGSPVGASGMWGHRAVRI